MFYEDALNGQRILVKREKDGEILADTKIIKFNMLTNSVTISANNLIKKELCNVCVLIFGKKKLYEFHGTLKYAMVENEVEVLLGKSKEKEDRKRTRYKVRLKGTINSVWIQDRNIILRKPIDVKTINMSSIGILIKTDAGSFDVGSRFTMLLTIDKKEFEFDCEVVRIQNKKVKTEEYGCSVKEAKLL